MSPFCHHTFQVYHCNVSSGIKTLCPAQEIGLQYSRAQHSPASISVGQKLGCHTQISRIQTRGRVKSCCVLRMCGKLTCQPIGKVSCQDGCGQTRTKGMESTKEFTFTRVINPLYQTSVPMSDGLVAYWPRAARVTPNKDGFHASFLKCK